MFVTFLIFLFISFSTQTSETILVKDSYLPMESINNTELPTEFSSEEGLLTLPNISTSKGSNKTKFLQVRGLGQRESFSPLLRRYNQFYLDEVDYSQYPQAFELYGFNKTDINYGPSLRGAGGATFSSQSTESKNQYALKTQIKSSSFDYQSQKVAYKSSSKTFLKPSFSAIRIKEDGFYQNTFLDRDDTNNRDEFYLRTNFTTPKLYNQNLKYNFHYNRLNNGYDAFAQDNSTTMTSDHPGQDDINMQVHQLSLNSNNKNNLYIEFMKAHTVYSYDEDWGNDPQWLNVEGFNSPYNYFMEFITQKERYSIYDIYEFANTRFELRYTQSKESHIERGFSDEAERSNIQSLIREQNLSLNTSRVFFIGEKTSLKAGAGIQRHDLAMSNQNSSQNFSEELLNAELSLNYNSLFTNIKSAEIPGGINMQSIIPESRSRYTKERVSTVETGLHLKNHFSDNKIALFYTLRNNPQVKTSFQADPNDPSTFSYYNDNSKSATHYGAEFTNKFFIKRWLTWESSISFLKTSYNDYSFSEQNLEKRELPHSPEYQLVLAPTINISKRSNLSLKFYQQDNFYFSNSHDQRASGYSLLDLKASVRFGDIKLGGFINNLLDKTYQTRGFFFGNNPPNFDSELYTQLGRPRTIGISLDMNL
jgi:hypothetical protein